MAAHPAIALTYPRSSRILNMLCRLPASISSQKPFHCSSAESTLATYFWLIDRFCQAVRRVRWRMQDEQTQYPFFPSREPYIRLRKKRAVRDYRKIAKRSRHEVHERSRASNLCALKAASPLSPCCPPAVKCSSEFWKTRKTRSSWFVFHAREERCV